MVALDISSAFGLLPHPQAVKTLLDMQVPLFLVRWIVNFLTARNSYIKNLSCSLVFPLSRGILQGSPLSPLLFICFQNPLLRCLPSATGYTDDLILKASERGTPLDVAQSGDYLVWRTWTIHQCPQISLQVVPWYTSPGPDPGS